MPADPAKLERVLGHVFADGELLTLALRHASTAETRTDSNERLEFLGDRVLGLTIATLLYERFPGEEEGALARRFAGLSSREALARVAGDLGLHDYIRTQPVDAETHKRSLASVTADTLEAVLGALYLDGGLEPPYAFIAKYWEGLICEDLSPPKDAKTTLQEWAQGQGLGLPKYDVVSCEGPDHAPTFIIRVTVEGFDPESGQGGSRRAAEQNAALALLAQLENTA